MDADSIFTSTVIATLVSGAITALYGVYAKRQDFANNYHVMILNRRIDAYSKLEHVITIFTTTGVGEDNMRYHSIFNPIAGARNAQSYLIPVVMDLLWFSTRARYRIVELNTILYPAPTGAEAVEFAKSNYDNIMRVREQLESILADDLLSLHDVPKFLKEKQSESSRIASPTEQARQ